MTTRIWIVTTGSYSDYQIQGAYTTEQEAIEHAIRIEKDEGYFKETDIEVYEGHERIWNEELQRRPYYRIDYIAGAGKPYADKRESYIFTHDVRAKVKRRMGNSFSVEGTDLTEVKKVFSDTLTADVIRAAQAALDEL